MGNTRRNTAVRQHGWAMAGAALAAAVDASENQLFVNRNLSTLGRKSAQRRHFWAMSICGHCRGHAPTTKVFTCYRMRAHHREVVSVDAQGARESVGILSPASEQLMHKNHVLPVTQQLGTIVDLDPNSTVEADDKVTFLVSCEECAGLPLRECIEKEGHVQQVCSYFVCMCACLVAVFCCWFRSPLERAETLTEVCTDLVVVGKFSA